MANSVVNVTDSMLSNSLLLLVGEDGTVTPDRETVETYLNSKSGSTNIRLMHINKTDDKGIDISVDDLTYVPDVINEVEVSLPTFKQETNMNELERNLHSFRLDHDYTSFEYTSATEEPPLLEELIQTNEREIENIPSEKVLKDLPPPILFKSVLTSKQEQMSTDENQSVGSTDSKNTPNTSIKKKANIKSTDWQTSSSKPSKTPERVKLKEKPKIVQQIEDEFEDDLENDDNEDAYECEDDDYEPDYDPKETSKSKVAKKIQTARKSLNKTKTPVKQVKSEHNKLTDNQKGVPKSQPHDVEETLKTLKALDKNKDNIEKDKATSSAITEKKIIKREKKIPKSIPNDFMLFSTPDIIRRVGKDSSSTNTSEISISPKIVTVSGIKSTGEQSTNRSNRLSVDSKTTEKLSKLERINDKSKQRRASTDKIGKSNIDEKTKSSADPKKETATKSSKPVILQNIQLGDNVEQLALEPMPTPEDIRSIIMTEDVKSYTTSTLPLVQTSEISSTESMDQNIALDTSSLDIDQSLLDNINSDEISEDILYQVAQSLVGNTDLQNAIDKGLNDGNLILDPVIQGTMTPPSQAPFMAPANSSQKEDHSDIIRKGTQIVRPDGRIVVIPPIERPTTRSRNRRQNVEPSVTKAPIKPLDNEHVSGNELDSSDDEDNEDESEDDPNKLWCICNQPHNNRFMICCDTCEEWYHGKCVNITKAMGQQMEEEGREWICLFCKDPSLKRPQAAARRIRKASRTSTDSAESSKKNEESASQVTCIVCQRPARTNSIYCSQKCILTHASGIDRVVVVEKSTGRMLSGNKAPSSAKLEQWLKDHPTFEVYRTKEREQQRMRSSIQSKLKIIKNAENDGVSLEVRKKGVKVGILRHLPKNEAFANSKFEIKSPPPKPTGIRSEAAQPQKFYAKTATVPGTKKTEVSPKLLKPTTPVTPNRPKLIQTTLKTTPTSSPKDKSVPLKTPKARQAEQQTTPQSNPKQQENIRENVQKTLFEQLTNRLKLSGNLKLSEEEVKEISNEIESQLYKCFGDTGQKYRNKYRSLIFNIKDIKNQTLWKRICQKSINAYQLVRLSPDDLASQELALWREREAKHSLEMIKKSELELLNCSRQYVLKTHKGEQVVDEESRSNDKIDNTEVIRTLTGDPHANGKESKGDSKDPQKKGLFKHSHRERERRNSKDRSNSKDHKKRRRSSSKDRDRSKDRDKCRRSSSKDRNKRERKRSRSKDRHRKSSHKSSRHKRDISHGSSTDKLDKKSKEILEQLVDNKIVPPLEDRLWKHVPQEDVVPEPAESDSDHEPSSTVTIPTPPHSVETEEQGIQSGTKTVTLKSAETKEAEVERSMSPPPLSNQSNEIWRGTISMIDVAHITITAHEVSGDCSDLGDQLPSNLDIVGRISPETVWDYIGKMKCSNSKIISLVRLTAVNVVEKMPYLALYSYLSSRKRLGVVKSMSKAIKDFYILPLAQQKPIPQALLPINGPGFEESRPALLLGIIVRDKRKRGATLDVTPSYSSLIPKKSRIATPPLPTGTAPVVADKSSIIDAPRSYTPPSSAVTTPLNKDPRLKILLPPALPAKEIDDGDEPYSPEDSDPDSSSFLEPSFTEPSILPPKPSTSAEPGTSLFPYTTSIPGLDVGNTLPLPASTVEIQKQMEELNKKIEAQKSEIHSISKNIVSASTEIGQSALANIALPSNLQQILDSIKTISTDGVAEETAPQKKSPGPNLTIPLILPKHFSRPPPAPAKLPASPNVDFPSNTIPLNLPTKIKFKVSANDSPHGSDSPGVLSSLSEEELVKKAAEMLGQTELISPSLEKSKSVSVPTVLPAVDNSNIPAKKAKFEDDESFDIEPPIPGIDN